MEWDVYTISGFVKRFKDTEFQAIKSGRRFGASAWGSLVDSKNKWGYEIIIHTGAGNVSNSQNTKINSTKKTFLVDSLIKIKKYIKS